MGCSDEKGITLLNSHMNTYVPCEFMISTGTHVVFMAEGSLGLMHLSKGGVTFNIQKIGELKKSCSMLGGFAIKGAIYLAGECSTIYQIVQVNQN